MPARQVKRLTEKYLSERQTQASRGERTAPTGYTPVRREGDHAVHQVHAVIGSPEYGMDDPKRTR